MSTPSTPSPVSPWPGLDEYERRNLVHPSAASTKRRRRHTGGLQVDFSDCSVCIPLRQSFTFSHEPSPPEGDSRYVGREKDIAELAARIVHSNGGTFLVTGFRGVGKTSFINQVIRTVRSNVEAARQQESSRLVDMHMSLPRRMRPVDLMHYIVRRLYERLDELGILPKLDRQLTEHLSLAYSRTSLVVTQENKETREVSLKTDIGWEIGNSKQIVKWPFGFQRSREQALKASYIAYDERSAEHDIIQISRKLCAGYFRYPRFLRQIPHFQQRTTIKVLFVFDELDKIEADAQPGQSPAPPLDAILRSLKTLLTTSGMSFIFVAGKDLYDHWLQDVGSGDSIYESIFAYDKYLPCLWYDSKRLADRFLDLAPFGAPPCPRCSESATNKDFFCQTCNRYVQSPAEARKAYENFLSYLAYRGRGIPRRTWRAFYQAVKWHNKTPVLAFTADEIQQHRVYAELWKLLNDYEADLFDDSLLGASGDSTDGPKLAICYLVDWILRRGSAVFEESDLVTWSRGVSAKIMPSSVVAEPLISRLLALLLKGGVIREVSRKVNVPHRVILDADRVKVEDLQTGVPRQYRLDPRHRKNLGSGVADLPEDLGLVKDQANSSQFAAYQVLGPLGSGGMARVYRAVEKKTGKQCALKVLEPGSTVDKEMRERFLREASILSTVSHPNIVRFYDWGDDEGRIYIAMELIEGVNLDQILTIQPTLSASEVVAISTAVTDALAYLHDKRLLRNDIKPSNIMISSRGKVCLIDLGTTKKGDDTSSLTSAGLVIGTPSYLAPEQIRGTALDERCDIYALGTVMYRMVTGRATFEHNTIDAQLYSILHTRPAPPSRYNEMVPPELEAAIMQCLEKDPDRRPRSAADLRAILSDMDAASAEQITFLLGSALKTDAAVQRKAGATTSRRTVGEFTKLFQPAPQSVVPKDPFVAPVLPPPRPSSGPGEYTRMFGVPAEPEGRRRIAAGEFTMMFRSIGPSHTLVELEWIKGPEVSKKRARIANTRFTIGRGTDNHLVLNDGSVSRYHAEILWDVDGLWIEDKDSVSGTFLNGHPVQGQMELKHHDKLHIGGYEYHFHLSQPNGTGVFHAPGPR